MTWLYVMPQRFGEPDTRHPTDSLLSLCLSQNNAVSAISPKPPPFHNILLESSVCSEYAYTAGAQSVLRYYVLPPSPICHGASIAIKFDYMLQRQLFLKFGSYLKEF